MSLWRRLFGQASLADKLPVALSSFLCSVHGWSCPKEAAARAAENRSAEKANSSETARNEVDSVGFTIAAIVLSAKLAKADGKVTKDEVARFRQLFTIPDDEAENVGRVFNQARQDAGGYRRYAKQVAKLFNHEPKILSDLLGCLIAIAVADGRAANEEIDYLRDVASIFGIDESYFQDLFGEYSAGVLLAPIEDPYLLLGVTPDQSFEDMRSRYRQLVKESHPDRLRALGLPEERIDAATERMGRLNAAWEEVARKAAENAANRLAPGGSDQAEPAFA